MFSQNQLRSCIFFYRDAARFALLHILIMNAIFAKNPLNINKKLLMQTRCASVELLKQNLISASRQMIVCSHMCILTFKQTVLYTRLNDPIPVLSQQKTISILLLCNDACCRCRRSLRAADIKDERFTMTRTMIVKLLLRVYQKVYI